MPIDDSDPFRSPSRPSRDQSRFLSVSTSGRPPSKSRSASGSHNIKRNRSSTTLREDSLGSLGLGANGGGGGGGGGSRFSLAHELAAALLPEPSTGSKLLAEEFGIEYDEGAEGIDEEPVGSGMAAPAHDDGAGTGIQIIQGPINDSDDLTLDDLAPISKSSSGGGGGAGETPEAALETPQSTSMSTHSSPGGGIGSNDIDPSFGAGFGSPVKSPSTPRRGSGPPQPDQMAILSQSLESTERFLAHLRHLDTDTSITTAFGHGHTSSISSISGLPVSSPSPATGGGGGQPALERITLDMIRKIEQITRDREEQVRELLEYEREFRKIAGEAGGNDALANLEELDPVEDLLDKAPSAPPSAPSSHNRTSSVNGVPLQRRGTLESLQEEATGDWEVDPDQHWREDEDERDEDPYDLDPNGQDGEDRELLGDELDRQTENGGDDPNFLTSPSPMQTTFGEGSPRSGRSRGGSHSRTKSASSSSNALHLPPPPPITQPVTPAKTIPQLAHLRTYTTSLVSSLSAISEHAQVNGAKTTDAGRKIRALKNKLGGWRQEWETAERSRVKIERWEAGIADVDAPGGGGIGSGTATPIKGRRIDGRVLVKEQLEAFEKALLEANQKTQAIMAAS